MNHLKECVQCENTTRLRCCLCDDGLCKTCEQSCSSCAIIACVECTTECDMCGKVVCDDCKVLMRDCSCCPVRVNEEDAATFCADCSKGLDGFVCDPCITMECGETCKVKCIWDSQTSCPVCLEDFKDETWALQTCGLHKLCNICSSNEALNAGCPVCREGWVRNGWVT